jgi:hypothetical protein
MNWGERILRTGDAITDPDFQMHRHGVSGKKKV